MTDATTVRKVAHRLWQGKSEEKLKVLPPNSVDLVLTDPPFGVDNQSNMSRTGEGKQFARKIANDSSVEQAIETFETVMDVLLPKTKEHCDLYVFTSDEVLLDWLDVMREIEKRHGFVYTRTLVWRKGESGGGMTPGLGDLETWGSGVEFILYAKKGRKPRYGDRRGAVIDCPPIPPGKLIHPHEKPARLLKQLIDFSTEEGDLVVDPFCGSGSTARAAMQANRSCITCEYDEHNHKLAVEKFEAEKTSIF